MIIPNTMLLLFVSLYLSMVLRALFRNDCEHLCDDDHLRDFKFRVLCLKEKKYFKVALLFFSQTSWFIYILCSFCLGYGHLLCMRNDKLVLTISSNFIVFFSKSLIGWIMMLNETNNPRTTCSTCMVYRHAFILHDGKKKAHPHINICQTNGLQIAKGSEFCSCC